MLVFQKHDHPLISRSSTSGVQRLGTSTSTSVANEAAHVLEGKVLSKINLVLVAPDSKIIDKSS